MNNGGGHADSYLNVGKKHSTNSSGVGFGNAQNKTTLDETGLAQSSLGVGLEEVAVFIQCLKLLGPFTISLFDQIQIGLTKSSTTIFYYYSLV